MSERISQQELARVAAIADAPARTKVDRTFGLPTGLYVTTAAAYFGFLAVMAGTLLSPGLVIPLAIIALFFVMIFGVPAMWVRMNPEADGQALTFNQLRHRGIETLTGRLTATEASVQVLILPVLILAWGIACAVIIALI